jgi:hypothetical protein
MLGRLGKTLRLKGGLCPACGTAFRDEKKAMKRGMSGGSLIRSQAHFKGLVRGVSAAKVSLGIPGEKIFAPLVFRIRELHHATRDGFTFLTAEIF